MQDGREQRAVHVTQLGPPVADPRRDGDLREHRVSDQLEQLRSVGNMPVQRHRRHAELIREAAN